MGASEDPQHIIKAYSEVMQDIERTEIDNVAEEIEKVSRVRQDEEEWIKAQKKYLWKLDYILLPAVTILYFFEYLNRGNVGNAKLYGWDAGHNSEKEAVGLGAKSLSSSGLPLVYADEPLPVSSGALEDLFGMRIVYYLSLWYHRTELGMRVSWFLGPTSIAGAIGGLIAYGIGRIRSDTPAWKWLFSLKPCLFFGWDYSVGTGCQTAQIRTHASPAQLPTGGWMRKLRLSPDGAMISSISGFLQTIIRNLGYTEATKANPMTAPPYASAFILMFLASYSSDHFCNRGRHVTILMSISTIISTIAYALFATLPEANLHGKYACVCIAVACVYATYPPTQAWVANNFGNETKRPISMGLYTALGNLGLRRGISFTWGLSIATAVLALASHMLLEAIDKRRDKKYRRPVPGQSLDVSEFADSAPMFRFIT
ncbi:conserved hypothetical protein [Talaromyces stipitatus ATCC 10500]|uniref:Uncharacterized protein n=1 Tax=Talaromyces stipitatus (strain ATCC 10500 / CBS 375.48 / QM 6759 / NRRL 1006) TaxID=441959 RepID=B8MSS0_TALSN|nr:uncharacterized protein TSTA_006280 [Talaromyces stipitatus ATCC 10500]EED12602.1 conserved hypothetical protein [Talaromyces stipitatus ATCC 10500]